MNKLDADKLLEEAKRRFPIGCSFYAVKRNGTLGTTPRVQKTECFYYEDDDGTWIIGSYNIRNPQGVWAKKINPPEAMSEDTKNRLKQMIEVL